MVARRILLKRGRNRTVLREQHAEVAQDADAALVVKRFHARGLARFRDRRRALREKRILERLRELDLPAPRAGDVRREADGAWVLPLEDVGERTLASILAETSGSEGDASGRIERDLALALGELVAAFLAAGALHRDPHPGNVVLDARGRPWVVDGCGIRFALVPRARTVTAQLAAMAATVRERLSARDRARVFAEIWRRLPDALRGTRSRRLARVREIETRARALRLADVLANLDRWTRESGVCVEVAQAGEPSALERRDGARNLAATGLLVVAGDRALAAWRTAARLLEHSLSVTPPHRLEPAPRPRALFELEASARPLDLAVKTLPPESLAPLARRMGALLGSFHDRGLRLVLARGGDVLVSAALEPIVSPLARVDDLARSASERLCDAARAPGVRELESDPILRRCLRAGYASAFGEATERRAIRAELARG